ncbi:hypothetical protein PCANC_26992 [Puccinia coronata f. sp. avenae]|uniref:CCHC-type domain-containing protein n=1 Tax=Puccinia coronata f. sp. avenae TaxID=200324 RepID=A0A2N5S228_9BASI|nr:hypothetical protein PCANC_26992 [Puccinia coronata f. sp. avenae]
MQKQLPKGPDGSSKPPKWEHVIAAAEAEIRVEEPGFSNISGFAESNQVMQKALDVQKGDGKRREKMLEEIPNQAALQKKIVDMEKEIASLKNQRASNVPLNYPQSGGGNNNEFSRGDPRPTGKLYEPKSCYYCHKEGHNTFKCPEALKDEQQGLVRRNGNDWFLPSGQQIPWNPNRPIRHVVATESAKNPQKPPVAAAFQTDHPSVFQIPQEDRETLDMTSAINRIDWEPPALGAANFQRVQMEANAATTRAEAVRGQRRVQREEAAMDIDQEEPIEEVIAEVPAARRTPGKILETPRAQKDKQSAESALLVELDNLKIPTTFSQLTAISPTVNGQCHPGKASSRSGVRNSRSGHSNERRWGRTM